MIRKAPDHNGSRGEDYVRRTARRYKEMLPWADADAIAICNAINVCYNAERAAISRRYDDLGFGRTLGRSTLLRVLYFAEGKPLTHNEIGAELQLTPGTVTYLVNELERDGLVTRAVDPGNRRTTHVALTAEGLDTCTRLAPALAELMAELCKDFTPEETSGFLTLLFKFARSAAATYGGAGATAELEATQPPGA